MNSTKTILVTFFTCLLFIYFGAAQPTQKLIKVQVNPEHLNWIYNLNENANFEVQILKNGQLIPNIKIRYEIGLEQMPPTVHAEKLLKNGKIILKGGKLDQPGFLRCHVWVDYNGKTYDGWGTAGYAPEKINPIVKSPDDFNEF